jgi:large subunit ribosomal protein L25
MRAEQVELPAVVRSEVGKTASRRLRARGQIPAVVYGKGAEPVPLAVDEAVFARAVSASAWYHTLISLKIEGTGDESEGRPKEGGRSDAHPTVMIAEVQSDIVRRKVVSIDFRRVSLSERVHTHVAIRHIGESPGLKKGGIIDQVTHEVMVECLPTEMPDHLEVDISGLEIGESVRMRDVVVPAGVRILAPEEEAVIVIAAPVRVEAVEPPPAEEGALVAEAEQPEVVGEPEES